MNINHEKGRTFDSDIEKNKWASKNERLSDGLKQIIDELNKKSFLENLYNLSKFLLFDKSYTNPRASTKNAMVPIGANNQVYS